MTRFCLLAGPTLALTTGALEYQQSPLVPPAPAREFRGAWVASVANIDWPSKPGLSSADQKAELIAILERAVQLRLNVIVLQVRPACDALYASTLEPWSEYLTGTMGEAPDPFYDPLSFAVDEAHKRGLELHAWFNPYRAHHGSAKSPISANHISKTHPDLVRQYGKYLWLDPGEKAVQDYSLSVVLDVVRRYDIDGVHFDDYFYPYKVKDSSGQEVDFPDEASWKKFGARGKLSRDDWRRENVNTFIERIYTTIKATKPWVKFGVSPFGIWRPGNPPQIQGFDAYGKLYADSRKWLNKGWLDYFVPQLYWSIDAREQSFPVLLKWWREQNRKDRHLFPGLDSTKARSRWSPGEIVSQIRLTRQGEDSPGHVHWNMRSLMLNPVLGEALEREVYSQPALTPASPWLDKRSPEKPRLEISSNGDSSGTRLKWQSGGAENAFLWLLQTRSGGTWKTEVLSGRVTSRTIQGTPDVIALSAIDRTGNASRASVFAKMK